MDNNPKLKKSPLSEVIFDLRFEPNKNSDYALLAGRLNEKLSTKYPKTESRTPANLPLGIPGNIIRHRFFNNKDSYQTGETILTISTFNYKSFQSFLDNIKEVLKAHQSIFKPSNTFRLGLRYINQIDLSHYDSDKILDLEMKFPLKLKENNNLMVTRLVNDFNQEGKLATVMEINCDKKKLILDFDFFLEELSKYDIEKIVKWIVIAHNNIYQNFIACLNSDYLKRIK